MRGKSTLILLAVTVAVAAYVSVYELKQPTREERADQARIVADVDPDSITAIQVAAPDVAVTLAREGERWRLTAPVAARADEMALTRLLYFLHPLGAQRVLDGATAAQLAEYGLAPPQATITLTTPEGPVELRFGFKTAVGDAHYVQRDGRSQVYLVRNFVLDTFNRPLDTYRARTVLEFDPARLAHLATASPHATYALDRVIATEAAAAAPERWLLTEPVVEPADAAQVAKVLGTLRGLQSERFVSDAPLPEQLAEWGLQAPSARVSLTLEGATGPVELLVGNPLPENAEWRYVSVSSAPGVVAVAQDQLASLWIDPSVLLAQPSP